MKVVAIFQFYLPYFLPRTSAWSDAPYLQDTFEVEGHIVNVHPRKVEERLFPSDIDNELRDLKIKVEYDFAAPIDAPIEISLRDRCFDRLEAQVFGEVDGFEDCLKPEVTFAYRRLALSACNSFLYHCRLAGRDPEIEGLDWHYSFDDDRCYFTFPHSLVWFDAQTKQRLRDDKGHPLWTAQPGSMRTPIRLPVELSALQQSFLVNREPNLPIALLVSAKKHLQSDHLHEGIVNLASACEIAFTRYIEGKGLTGSARVTAVLNSRGLSFAKKRYHKATLQISRRSLQADNPVAFDHLENAYKTRNSVVHGGELSYKDPSGIKVLVKRSTANDFYLGCERAIDWIENL